MQTSFMTEEEIREIGFASVGEDVKISRKASIYSPEKMEIGNHIRIDDFCLLSGEIVLKDHVHLAAYVALYGEGAGIVMDEFSGCATRVSVFSATDDYLGESLTNSTVPDEFKHVREGHIHIGKHVIVGATSVVLPGVTLAEGSSFGTFSMINKDSEPWTINAGIPAKKIRERSREMLEFEKKLRQQEAQNEE